MSPRQHAETCALTLPSWDTRTQCRSCNRLRYTHRCARHGVPQRHAPLVVGRQQLLPYSRTEAEAAELGARGKLRHGGRAGARMGRRPGCGGAASGSSGSGGPTCRAAAGVRRAGG